MLEVENGDARTSMQFGKGRMIEQRHWFVVDLFHCVQRKANQDESDQPTATFGIGCHRADRH